MFREEICFRCVATAEISGKVVFAVCIARLCVTMGYFVRYLFVRSAHSWLNISCKDTMFPVIYKSIESFISNSFIKIFCL